MGKPVETPEPQHNPSGVWALLLGEREEVVYAMSDEERRKLLRMAFLWPWTVVGVFLPWVAYLKVRRAEDSILVLQTRRGAVAAGVYVALVGTLGCLHGLVARLVDDARGVTFGVLVCWGVVVLGFGVWGLFGLRTPS